MLLQSRSLRCPTWCPILALSFEAPSEAEQEATLTEGEAWPSVASPLAQPMLPTSLAGVEEIPSDTLMVRLIGELEEARIKKAGGEPCSISRHARRVMSLTNHVQAFQSHVPVVKGVPVSMSD